MSTELLPVGIPGGINSGFSSLPPGTGIIRLGNETLAVDGDRYRFWFAAHEAPEAETILNWAAEAGIDDPESILRTLKDARLVVQRRSDPRLVAAHAIRLIGTCMGNGNEAASPFVIRGSRGALVACGLLVYEALLRSNGVVSITNVCAELQAEVSSDLSVLGEVVDSLPVLVRRGIVRLDIAQ